MNFCFSCFHLTYCIERVVWEKIHKPFRRKLIMPSQFQFSRGQFIAERDNREPVTEISNSKLSHLLQKLAGEGLCVSDIDRLAEDPVTLERVNYALNRKGCSLTLEDWRSQHYFIGENTLFMEEVSSAWSKPLLLREEPILSREYSSAFIELRTLKKQPRLVYHCGMRPLEMFNCLKFHNAFSVFREHDKERYIDSAEFQALFYEWEKYYSPLPWRYYIVCLGNGAKSSPSGSNNLEGWEAQENWIRASSVSSKLQPFRPPMSMILEMWISSILCGKFWSWFHPDDSNSTFRLWEHVELFGKGGESPFLLTFQVAWPNDVMLKLHKVEFPSSCNSLLPHSMVAY